MLRTLSIKHRTQIIDERGDSAPLTQELPKGTVSAAVPSIHRRPVLRCAGDSEGGTLPLVGSHQSKLVAEKDLQRAVTAVAEWGTYKENVPQRR